MQEKSMAASVFNEQLFENRLVNLKDSQESIISLSQWCLQNRDHHKKIVNCWLHCLKRVKIEQRLSLFYLANDVIQYSKRKHYQFVESWGTALQKATTLVRDDKVKARVMRIFKIWDERGVYDEAFIADLCGLLTTNIKKKTEANTDSSEFQPSTLIGKIRDCKVLEEDTDLRFRKVKENALLLTDADNMRTHLKDRRHGTDVVAEVDQGVKRMEAYVKALELEIAEREKLIEILHQATLFYESQRGEAKIVSNAYRNFGNKVKLLKRKLDELIPTLTDSPIPSPDINAPSPSPDSDLELPNDKSKSSYQQAPIPENNGLNFSFMNSTFMGNSQFLDLNLERDIFNDSISHMGNNHMNVSNDGVRAIEVINTREQKKDDDFSTDSAGFSISDFIKSLLPTGVPKPEDSPDAVLPVIQPDSMQPIPPPPMPPIFSTDDGFTGGWKPDWGGNHNSNNNEPWNHEPPPPQWPVAPPITEPWVPPNVHNSDTPESPPLYEKEAVRQPVEYDDSVPPPPVADVDHRTLMSMNSIEDMDHRLNQDIDHRLPVHRQDVDQRKIPKMGPKDIDHRNLISLTGSPKKETKLLPPPPPPFVWPGDQDYRSKPGDIDFRISQRQSDFSELIKNTNFNPSQPPPKAMPEAPERKDVNVESIDMDVSEEDDEESGNLIQEDDVDERMVGPMDSSFLNQSNITNFNMSSSFVNNMGQNVPNAQDVDERLKSIFGAKVPPPEFEEESSRSNEAQILNRDENENQTGSDHGSEDGDMNNFEPNGFGNDFLDRFGPERWQNNEQMEQQLPPHQFRMRGGGDFPPRPRWNSPRGNPNRGRGGNPPRFPRANFEFRPNHPRLEMIRGRMPFRPRMPVRGGRW